MLISAMAALLKEAESPNNHKRRTGKCPRGFVSDTHGRCIRVSRLQKNKRSLVRHRGRGRRYHR
jgi:hypothetical protein